MVSDVYLMMLDVIPPRVALAARESSVAEPTHEERIERLGAMTLVATAKGAGNAVDLTSTIGLPSIQDGVGIGTEWCEWGVITDVHCGKGGSSTSQAGPCPHERITREGAYRHSLLYAYEVIWPKGIRVRRRGRRGLHETAATQVGGCQCLQVVPGGGRE